MIKYVLLVLFYGLLCYWGIVTKSSWIFLALIVINVVVLIVLLRGVWKK